MQEDGVASIGGSESPTETVPEPVTPPAVVIADPVLAVEPASEVSLEPGMQSLKRKGQMISARILSHLQKDPAALNWSARQWADFLDCSVSTVGESHAWATIRSAQAIDQADATTRRREGD